MPSPPSFSPSSLVHFFASRPLPFIPRSAPKFQPPSAHNAGPLGRWELGSVSPAPLGDRLLPGFPAPAFSGSGPSWSRLPPLGSPGPAAARARPAAESPLGRCAGFGSLHHPGRRIICPLFSEPHVEGARSSELQRWFCHWLLRQPDFQPSFSVCEMGQTSFVYRKQKRKV